MQPRNPIEHVVIIVKENRSFDNYFGSYAGVNGAKLSPAQDPPAGGDPRHGMAEAGNTPSEAAIQRKVHSPIFLIRKTIHAM